MEHHGSSDEHGILFDSLSGSGVEFSEGRLDIGEETYVFGPVRRDPETKTPFIVGPDNGDGWRELLIPPAFLGDRDPSVIRKRATVIGAILIVIGLFTVFIVLITIL